MWLWCRQTSEKHTFLRSSLQDLEWSHLCSSHCHQWHGTKGPWRQGDNLFKLRYPNMKVWLVWPTQWPTPINSRVWPGWLLKGTCESIPPVLATRQHTDLRSWVSHIRLPASLGVITATWLTWYSIYRIYEYDWICISYIEFTLKTCILCTIVVFTCFLPLWRTPQNRVLVRSRILDRLRNIQLQNLELLAFAL